MNRYKAATDKLDNRLGKVETATRENTTAVARLGDAVEAGKAALDKIDDRFDKVDDRFDKVGGQLDKVETATQENLAMTKASKEVSNSWRNWIIVVLGITTVALAMWQALS